MNDNKPAFKIFPSCCKVIDDYIRIYSGGGFGKFEFKLSGTGSSRTELLNFSITGVTGDTIHSYAMLSNLNPAFSEFFAAHIAGFDITNGETSAHFAGSTPLFLFLQKPGYLLPGLLHLPVLPGVNSLFHESV